MEAWSPLWT
uniref:Uncharacterized protein n=1 Tax=Arundo donax TaxID=35708 RepID=A0A0A9ATS6_ARUDO